MNRETGANVDPESDMGDAMASNTRGAHVTNVIHDQLKDEIMTVEMDLMTLDNTRNPLYKPPNRILR